MPVLSLPLGEPGDVVCRGLQRASVINCSRNAHGCVIRCVHCFPQNYLFTNFGDCCLCLLPL